MRFFFFSSRRRHTRFDCDWSSDVCSSDLDHGEPTFELLRSLGERVARGETCYSVVRPVAYRKDLRTLVLEEAPGTALQQLLQGGHDPAAALRITARAGAAFNQDDVGNGAV